ncbi:hypothetical protein [Streptacidiphilus albus]|uniref:hypothetical protein n=1 Tax=Streptacidiphilus albus TaxID=105425 RepID=UPI000A64750D|nr:hypothetical protein [Streptacidiphilus albus]
MLSRIRRTAVLATAAGLLALVPGASTAAAASSSRSQAPAITLSVGAHGVPRSLKQGQTIAMVVWYRQNSGLPMLADDFAVSMWNSAAPGNKPNKGVTVSWQSPVTGAWQKPTSVDDNGTWNWYPPLGGRQVVVPSNYWAHINVRITFSGSAYKGRWYINPEPACAYALIAKDGSQIAPPIHVSWPLYTFTLNR